MLLTFEVKIFAETTFHKLNDCVNFVDLITLLINYAVQGYSIKFSNHASLIKVAKVSLIVHFIILDFYQSTILLIPKMLKQQKYHCCELKYLYLANSAQG